MAEKNIGVLIIDDEEIVRKGFRNIISWEDLNCTIVGEAENCTEALEKIQQLKPQIVLLDVNMPGMNGISLLEEVYNNPEAYPSNPQFLILSGYSDFEYAQSAINFGAKGYIVKPVDEDILEEKIRQIVQDIDRISEASSLKDQVLAEEQIQGFRQLFLLGSLNENLTGKVSDHENHTYQVALVSPELCGYADKMDELKKELEESLDYTSHLVFSLDWAQAIIFYNQNQETAHKHLERFCAKMQKQILANASETTYISGPIASCGDLKNGLYGALQSFEQARKCYQNLFFFNRKPFICPADLASLKQQSYVRDTKSVSDEFEAAVPEVIRFIEVYDLQKISSRLSELKSLLISNGLKIDDIKKITMAFIVELQTDLQKKHPERQQNSTSALELVNLIYNQTYFEAMFSIVEEFAKSLAEDFTSVSSNSTILKVIQYVKTNYNTDLKMEMLGNLFNCNSAYLGKKFREYTGVPFNTYLDIIRIDQAKQMILSTDLKIYEISKLVGYANTDYFYLKFKKLTNMTPKEFKGANKKDS